MNFKLHTICSICWTASRFYRTIKQFPLFAFWIKLKQYMFWWGSLLLRLLKVLDIFILTLFFKERITWIQYLFCSVVGNHKPTRWWCKSGSRAPCCPVQKILVNNRILNWIWGLISLGLDIGWEIVIALLQIFRIIIWIELWTTNMRTYWRLTAFGRDRAMTPILPMTC